MCSRYFFPEPNPNGNIFWNPDDNPYSQQKQFQWITLVALPEWGVKGIVRLGQLAIVALIAWAIGWRKLPRDDGRRALHYGLVTLGILLLNQRTWDHHAAILIPAAVAAWYAIAFGRFGRRTRLVALVLMLGAGPLVWFNGTTLFKQAARLAGHSSKVGDHWANVAEAYGPGFAFFVVLFVVLVTVTVALKQSPDPYAPTRQTLAKQP